MDKIQEHEAICRELTELYKKKNADYGDSFAKTFEEYGLIMSAIRLEDKLQRFKRLMKVTSQVVDESIEDTLIDMANYAIMTLIEIRKE